MIRSAAIVLVGSLLLFSSPAFAEVDHPLVQFQTEVDAQKHCPADVVVWLNLPTGVYHFKGQRWYANTKHGAYVCQKEAEQAGDRATKNGQ